MSIIDEAYEIFDIRIVKKLDNYIDYFYTTLFSFNFSIKRPKINIQGIYQITTMKAIMAS